MRSSFTSGLNDLAAPEAVSLAEDRLDGLQLGSTPMMHTCRVYFWCPSSCVWRTCDAWGRVWRWWRAAPCPWLLWLP